MLANIIQYSLSNFSLSMFILAIVLAILNRFINRTPSFYEILYRWVAFLALGITGIYSFVMHGFFPAFTAATIGWQTSPFQFEIAVANLGFGIVAILSTRRNYEFRQAAIIANTIWLWGDAVGHAHQMSIAQNYSSGNAGTWFCMDILIPLVTIICLVKIKPHN